MKIRRGDMVKVMAGKDKGRTGVVEYVSLAKNEVLVKGLNLCKKSVKRDQSTGSGGIVDITKPIHASKLMVVCPNCSESSRLGIKFVGKKKSRYCKKCGELISKKVKKEVNAPEKLKRSIEKKVSNTKKFKK